MKSWLSILLSTLFFHTPSFAIERRDLAELWMNARYQNCGEAFLMQIETRNNRALLDAVKGPCAQIDQKNLEDSKTRACLISLNKTLQIFLTQVPNAAENQGCVEKPEFADYIRGDSAAIKAKDEYSSVFVSCTGTSDNGSKFTLVSADGKVVCSRKFECKYKFQFGQNNVDSPGTYYLRCKSGASAKDCSEMTLHSCEGKEVSYARVYTAFGKNLHVTDSTPVKSSKAPAAQ